mgnify:FL=1
MERGITFSAGEYYHIYNRGVEKRHIFETNADRKRFLRLLYVCNGSKPVIMRDCQGLPLVEIDKGEDLVGMGAYCLMPNHFHLLIRETVDGGISKFMSKLTTAYSMYFNKRYDRKGTLFEKPFRARHIDDDNYLKYLFSYIHLNPVKMIDPAWKERGVRDLQKTKKYLDNYHFSSYADYFNQDKREESLILKQELFPDYFSVPSDFKSFIAEWLTFTKDSPW